MTTATGWCRACARRVRRKAPGPSCGCADYKRLISTRGGEYAVKGVTEIDLETTQAMLEAGAVLVDVRPATDFESGHIPGSVSLSLPVALSSDSLGEVARPDGPVIFSCFGKHCPYCSLRGRKGSPVGHTRVYRFAGGFRPGRRRAVRSQSGPASATARVAGP